MPIRRRIVAGYDGSPAAAAAVRFAAAEAAGDGGILRLLHAQLERAAYALLVPPGVVRDAAAEAWRLVDAAAEALRRDHPGLDVRATVVAGKAASALIRASRSADVLVLGRTLRGAPAPPPGRRISAGATAARVMEYTSCPVMVVGADAPPPGEARGRPVLLGLDPAASSSPAVTYAFEAARRRGTSLRVCFVQRPDGGSWPDDADTRRALSEALAAWRVAFADVPVAVDVLPGLDPAARLLDASADAALVVVGDRDPGAPATGGPHRVPDVLTRNAACPVTVVRAARRPALRPVPTG
ncbi:universal stress protein [Dactylosporangium sp. NPDC048998]|uniref:universal stress protein n=1 Tax=Dactylosporangium sp. NPDC048998 TaxID=3363976 RepID=UPI0037176E52